jgi:RND family efflux transporter MFP subunit
MRGASIGPAAAAALFLCISVAQPACRRQAQPVERETAEIVTPVGAVRAETAGIRAVVRGSGVVAPAEGGEFLVVPPEPARILEIPRMEGDAVRSGDVLVRFELTSATQDVNRLSAELAGAQAQLENARINQTRVRDFVERGLVPRRDLEVAERELADAQGAVDRIGKLHAAATAAAARAVVRAPFDGIVVNRRHAPGDLVLSSTADPVLRLVDPRRLEVVASVGEKDIARVVTGATARIAIPGSDMPIRLTVAQRLADRVGADGTLPIRLVFQDVSELPPDARVDVEIDAEERSDAVLVPAGALITEGGENVVMVAAGERAERRVVTTGIQTEDRVEITSGLKSGELVITRGHIGLADGAPISVATDVP